jgi:dinuclear metal center YbgI/SA1388 family protein
MPSLRQITAYLDILLPSGVYTDRSQNGLQVDAQNEDVKKIAVAVDSGLSVIEKAVELKAELLIVHHGLFWSTAELLSGPLGRKISKLMRNGCSLYASHLPLDGNMELGNAAQLAKLLNLKDISAWCLYAGSTIGAAGNIENPCSLEDIEKNIRRLGSMGPFLTFPFGKKQIRSIGIVTGSGTSAIPVCAESKVDLLISGEPKQEAYHTAKELQVNVLFAGHYATETFGVKAVADRLKQEFSLETFFIDEPTGI